MKFTKGHFYFTLSVILASFRPIFYKQFKEYFFMTVYLSLISMYSGGLGFMYYNLKKGESFKDKIIETLTPTNLLNSFISELRFILKQFAVINLPLTISIPMNNLWMVSSAYFGRVINNEIPTMKEIISIGILIIGAIVLNLNNLLKSGSGKKSKTTKSYYSGIISLLVSTILAGYIYSIFKKISTETKDSGFTMAVESGGSLIIATFLLIYDRLFCKKINMPSTVNIVKMFLAVTLLFNIDIIIRFEGLSRIKQLDTLFLSQVGTLIPVMIGFLYYGEKMDVYKIAGLTTIIAGVLYGSL